MFFFHHLIRHDSWCKDLKSFLFSIQYFSKFLKVYFFPYLMSRRVLGGIKSNNLVFIIKIFLIIIDLISHYGCQVLLDSKREVQNDRGDHALFFNKISGKRQIFLQSGTCFTLPLIIRKYLLSIKIKDALSKSSA
jgi:hypothetical protein